MNEPQDPQADGAEGRSPSYDYGDDAHGSRPDAASAPAQPDGPQPDPAPQVPAVPAGASAPLARTADGVPSAPEAPPASEASPAAAAPQGAGPTAGAQQPVQDGPPAQQPGSAPGAASMTPEELRAKLGGLGLINPLPSLAVGGIAYAGAFLVAVLGMILAAVAVALSGIGNPVEAGLDSVDLSPSEQLSGVATALRAPFQLVAMAAFGGLGFGVSYEGVTLRAVVRVLPGVITLAMVLLSFFGGRFVQKRQPAGHLGIWASSLLAGFGVAVFTVLAALILAQPIPIEDGITLRLHAAGFDSFFGALVLVTAALALGRISVRARPAWWPLIADLAAGLKLALSHALLLTVLGLVAATVITTVQALIDGRMPPMLAVLLLLPLAGGHVLAVFTGLPMLSAASASVQSPEIMGFLLGDLSGTMRASIFSMPWYVWLIGLLLGLVTLMASSLLWQHQRRVVPDNVIALAVSWAALPIAYFVGGVVLVILAHSSATFQVSGSFFDGSQRMSASAGLAAWTPFLALLAGVLVEVLSRVVAPLIAPFLPGVMLNWFRRRVAPAVVTAGAGSAGEIGVAAGAEGAAGAGRAAGAESAAGVAPAANADSAAGTSGGAGVRTVPLGATAGALAGPSVHPSDSGEEAAPRKPLSRGARRALIGGGVGVGAVLVLAVGLTVAYNVVAGSRYAPEKQVEAYLGALEEGDVERAVELAPPNVPTSQQILLTDAVGGAVEGRIDGHRITDVEESEGAARVTAEVTQDGVTMQQHFTVTRDGRTAVVFPNWRLGTVEYPSMAVYIPEGATTLIVNGQEIPTDGLSMEGEMAMLTVVPGTYSVTLPETSEHIAAVPSELVVSADPDSWYELFATPYYELSEAGLTEIQSQVDAQLDECASSTEPSPEGCDLSTWAFGIVEGSGSWEITEYPVVYVEPGEGGWYIATEYPDGYGAATYSYQYESWGSEDPIDQSDETSVSFTGVAVLDEEGNLVVLDE
ncbi:hypothetical protein ACT3SP_09105 [Brachybacterium sp. AOP43-C2-M15]|uniref:hypothetical protein n=1 Tax=Brachybacterium sp. AOP43-C2-M15 TaxID=3457661 RepID=UPI0040331A23